MALQALLDASVLYPAPVRDFLLHLTVFGLFGARWSHPIQEEWITNLLSDRPDLSREQLEHTRSRMDLAVPDALIVEFEELIPCMHLPDPNDRHVLAAAIVARVELIVTRNLRDFPTAAIVKYGLEALNPDSFTQQLLAMEPQQVIRAARAQRSALTRPAKTIQEFLENLGRHGLAGSVELIRSLHEGNPA